MSHDHDCRPTPDPAAEAYKLTTSFPYLVRRVGLRIGELFDRAVAPYGVNVSMYRVLAALKERDGQQLGDLAEMTTIELSTLSRLVGTMSTRGLVTRRRPRENGRIVEISLSARGRKLADTLVSIAVEFESIACGGLSEIERLKQELVSAYANLDCIERALGDGTWGTAGGTAGGNTAGRSVGDKLAAREPGEPKTPGPRSGGPKPRAARANVRSSA